MKKTAFFIVVLLSINFIRCKKDCSEDFSEVAWYQESKALSINADSSSYSVGTGDKRVFIFERRSTNCGDDKEIIETFFFERPVTEQGFSCLLDLSECNFFYQQKYEGTYLPIKLVRSGRIQAARQSPPEATIFRGSFGFKLPEPFKAVFDKDIYPNDVFVQPVFQLKQ